MDENQNTPAFRGLYRHVKISVKALDRIIIGCIVVIVIAAFVGLRNPGFVVSFDSQGGTDVEAVKYQYGALVEVPEPPTREGYVFDGWFLDPGCAQPWNLETDTVTQSMTLYACWVKNE